MNRYLVICIVGAALFISNPLRAQEPQGGGPGYEWGEAVPPPDLGPAPFAPPLPPSARDGKSAHPAGSSSVELPPALSDALSIYPPSAQAPVPKALADGEGRGAVFFSEDVDILKAFKRKADPADRLPWSVGGEVSGRGLEADESGRLIRLTLEESGLGGGLELSGAKSLIELKSTANAFSALKLNSLPSLTVVRVTGAELGGLAKTSLAALPALSVLSLNADKLDRLEPEAFSGLSGLDVLNLSGNHLKSVGRKTFSGLPRLVELNLSGNRIAEIQRGSFEALPRLINLDLSGNLLSEVSEGSFQGLGRLESLNLDNNQIGHLGRNALSGLKTLKSLNLSGNRLSSLSASLFSELESLAEVDLRGNSLPLSAMKTLQDRVSGGAYLRLRRQRDVYFPFRVQLLPVKSSFTVPAADAFINGQVSRLEILADDPSGAVYVPPEKPGEAGRLTFLKPGLYHLKLSNRELSDDPEVSALTGGILVVDSCPAVEEAAGRLGEKEAAAALVDGLKRRGFVELPEAGLTPKVKALFD